MNSQDEVNLWSYSDDQEIMRLVDEANAVALEAAANLFGTADEFCFWKVYVLDAAGHRHQYTVGVNHAGSIRGAVVHALKEIAEKRRWKEQGYPGFERVERENADD